MSVGLANLHNITDNTYTTITDPLKTEEEDGSNNKLYTNQANYIYTFSNYLTPSTGITITSNNTTSQIKLIASECSGYFSIESLKESQVLGYYTADSIYKFIIGLFSDKHDLNST